MTGLGGGPSKSDVARGGDGGLHHHHHHHQQQQQPDIRRPAPLQGVDGTQQVWCPGLACFVNSACACTIKHAHAIHCSQEAPSKAQPAPWAPATDAHTPAPQIHQHTQEQQQQQQQQQQSSAPVPRPPSDSKRAGHGGHRARTHYVESGNWLLCSGRICCLFRLQAEGRVPLLKFLWWVTTFNLEVEQGSRLRHPDLGPLQPSPEQGRPSYRHPLGPS
eukprot:1159191-Pelagomonas_calceolata.AAC.3